MHAIIPIPIPLIMPAHTPGANSATNSEFASKMGLSLLVTLYAGALILGLIDAANEFKDSKAFDCYAKWIFFTYGIGLVLGRFLFKKR